MERLTVVVTAWRFKRTNETSMEYAYGQTEMPPCLARLTLVSVNTFVKPPLSGWGMIATMLQQHRRDGRLTQLLHLTAYWMTYLHI
ncbi:hypothetical protein CYMTET_27596 [Cymbomonas tetramitiformis]|uniref:Uncharacterized protein n=1 Tax=Cymbomonas tetramitiformis TaxID=36881 RepID=A0AAE0FQ26_9CHLO|nr:hypothetical protein CYMTET_27596 [Cymbomonas tetramitiformis]